MLKTADIAADKLMRARSNLCLWGAPPAYSGKGRPRIHGAKFKLNDPQSWAKPVEDIEMNDPHLGRLRIRLWPELHFRKAHKHPMLLVRVERLSQQRCWRVPKPLWLAWVGEEMPPQEASLLTLPTPLCQAAPALDLATLEYSPRSVNGGVI